jgi:UPF0716 family protein affecting phage T7 exclusion
MTFIETLVIVLIVAIASFMAGFFLFRVRLESRLSKFETQMKFMFNERGKHHE